MELILATRHIEKKMAKNVKNSNSDKSISWRMDDKYFIESAPSRLCSAGVENYSAGWFAQAHTVLNLFEFYCESTS